ncbi:MAG: hypothetical protein AAF721_28005 [Myxococcota bacterium]
MKSLRCAGVAVVVCTACTDRDLQGTAEPTPLPPDVDLGAFAGAGAVPNATATDWFPSILGPGDLDGDGQDDLVLIGLGEVDVALECAALLGGPGFGATLRETPALRWRESPNGGWAMAAGDVDADGLGDLVSLGDGNAIKHWATLQAMAEGGAPGRFPLHRLDHLRRLSGIGDVDGDGAGELAADEGGPWWSDLDSVVAVVGRVGGDWVVKAELLGWVAVDGPTDFDGDGFGDLVLGKGEDVEHYAVAFGRGDASFELGEVLPTPAVPRASGDLDGDGADDLLVVDAGADDVHRVGWVRGGSRGPAALEWLTSVDLGEHNCPGCFLAATVVGDINGDGRSDVALGYQTLTPDVRDCWLAFPEEGQGCDPTGVVRVEIHLGPPMPGWPVHSVLVDRGPGTIDQLHGLGDLDGNGMADFVVGRTGFAADPGAAFVVLGAADSR